ncbi:trypsin-like serine peptidase [Natronoglycomyces albus]|uniref:Serine protease n=1 Tax=Natronoglycomyces albus TaxID=2811108 RepID=A0A895XSJ0_9ACTN|nr:trypsin-like serine protease [Natronoglycomyces albus]QSB06473.1 trypsin-like serine protease [Natronoglycomyces albus]
MRTKRTIAITSAALLAVTLASASASADLAEVEKDLDSLSPYTAVSDDGTIVEADEMQALAESIGSTEMVRSSAPDPDAKLSGVDFRSPYEHTHLGPAVALPDEYNVDSIIGSDDRVRVSPATSFPASATVNITRNGGNYCTGWLIGPDTVITAGHCLHSGGPNGSWYPRNQYLAWPGRDGGSTPYGSCSFTSFHSVVGWTQNGNSSYDYGAGKLNCNVGNATGTYGFRWQTASYNGTTSYNRGYPGDKPTGQQWMSTDQIRHSHDLQLFYRNDTVGGHSGGPIYLINSTCGVCGISVHAYGIWQGQPTPWGNHNYGPRITQGAFNNFITWRNA